MSLSGGVKSSTAADGAGQRWDYFLEVKLARLTPVLPLLSSDKVHHSDLRTLVIVTKNPQDLPRTT